MAKKTEKPTTAATKARNGSEMETAAPAHSQQLDPAGLEKIAAIGSKVNETFGKVALAMMAAPRYRHLAIGDQAHLVLDGNGNGRIDDGREMFGGFGLTGTQELSAHDQNQDGVINADHAVWAGLSARKINPGARNALRRVNNPAAKISLYFSKTRRHGAPRSAIGGRAVTQSLHV